MPINRYAAEVFFELRRIARIISLDSHKVEGQYQVTGPQLIVLRQILYGNASIPSDLARRVYLSQATVTGILDRLEAGGLIVRERKVSDRRQVAISLTERGRNLAVTLCPPLLERLSEEFETLSQAEQVDMAQALKRLSEILEDKPKL